MKVFGWIIEADGRWKFDDSNQTDQPVACTDLVADQENYKVIIRVPDVTQDWMDIERVEVLDESGQGRQLRPFDNSDINGIAFTEFMDTSGEPTYFDFDGSSIFLKPASSYAKTDGMTIYFNRAPLVFTKTDTTKRPGFASIFHEILSLGAKYDWEVAKNPAQAEQTMRDILTMKLDIKNFYSKREAYELPKLTRAYKSYK